jgi:hypothetical protein
LLITFQERSTLEEFFMVRAVESTRDFEAIPVLYSASRRAGAIEIYGYEWSFGYCPRGSGVYRMKPKCNKMCVFASWPNIETLCPI